MKNFNLKLCVFPFLLAIFCVHSVKHGEEIKCPGSYNCTCINGTTPVDHKLYCPNQDQRAIAVFTHPVGTEVKCFSAAKNTDYNLLKGLKMGSRRWLSFLECPLPSTSIGVLIETLDVKDLQTLTFRSEKNLGYSFLKKHLLGLENIPALYLSRNGLIDLPNDCFLGFFKLIHLDLSENNLQLHKNNFASTPNLEDLDLSYNNLAHLEGGVFANLTKLEVLSLRGNKLTELSRNVFSDLVGLEYLYVNGNKLKILPVDVFRDLVLLVRIEINLSMVSPVPEGLFSTNVRLRDITLVDFKNHSDLEIYMPNYYPCKYPKEFCKNLEPIVGKLFQGNPMQNGGPELFRRQTHLSYFIILNLSYIIFRISLRS